MGKEVATTNSGALVLQSNTALDIALLEQDAFAGFDNATAESYALPFLTILQSNSPQCKKTEGAYVKGAEEGMFFDTVTGKLYDGNEGVWVIPCHYKRSFIEWAPREAGGGYRGEHAPDRISPNLPQDKRGRLVLPNGNHLQDTRHHYVLLLAEDGSYSPAVISMTSTQTRKSRQWMTRMQGIKFKNAAGTLFTPPMFAHAYHITTRPEQNDQGSWWGWHIGESQRVDVIALFEAAKELRRALVSGEVRESAPHDDVAAAASPISEEDIAF